LKENNGERMSTIDISMERETLQSSFFPGDHHPMMEQKTNEGGDGDNEKLQKTKEQENNMVEAKAGVTSCPWRLPERPPSPPTWSSYRCPRSCPPT